MRIETNSAWYGCEKTAIGALVAGEVGCDPAERSLAGAAA